MEASEEKLEQRIRDTIAKVEHIPNLARTIPKLPSESDAIAKTVLRNTDDYLDLLEEIIDNGREDLVSKYGLDLLGYHNKLVFSVSYLIHVGITVPEELASKDEIIFHKFMGFFFKVEHEDTARDESGLLRTIYKPERPEKT